MRSAATLSVTALLLAACTVGPEYQPPVVDAPPQFQSQDVLRSLNEGLADRSVRADWWSGFGDPILDTLVQAGLENSLEIAAAAARVREARARVGLAGAGDGLQASTGAGAELQARGSSGGGQSGTTASISGDLEATLPLDVFGRTRREVEAARAGLEAATVELKGIVLGVSSDIASAYLGMRGSQRQLDLLRQSVVLQEKTLAIVSSRFASGLAPELDLLRAEASVQGLRAGVPPLEEDIRNFRNRIARLAGAYPGHYEQLLAPHRPIPGYGSAVPQVLPLDVLSTRADVRLAEAKLKQAIAEIGVAEADYYPAFRLRGVLGISAAGGGGASGASVLIGTLSALVTQVLADGGVRDANLEIARARADAALAEYELALRTATEEVEAVLAAIRSSGLRQVSLERAVRSSQRSFTQIETLYQQGLISFLDVVDAQRVLADAEQDLARERTNYATQIAVLFRALAPARG